LKKCNEINLKENSNKRNIVAFIPVRGGSKSIPLKNIRPFCGNPLVYWTIKAACECEKIDRVYIATDDERIKKVVENFQFSKAVVIDRDPSTVTDTASTESAMLDFASKFDFDDIILVQATSPLLECDDLTGGIEKYFSDKADSLLSVVPQKRFIWNPNGKYAKSNNYDPLSRPRRQEFDGYFVENGAFYITSKERLLATNCRLSGNISVYAMHEDTYFEIDELSDWFISEDIKRNRLNTNEKYNFDNINLLISDIDGVLTDAGMYYSTDGSELKKFNTRDGKGFELLHNAGLKIMLLTSEDIEVVKRRAEKLKVDYLFMGIKDKKAFLDKFFLENTDYQYDKTIYIGDDINDKLSMEMVAFAATPHNGHDEVKKIAKYICEKDGGGGCVREVCDIVLRTLKNKK